MVKVVQLVGGDGKEFTMSMRELDPLMYILRSAMIYSTCFDYILQISLRSILPAITTCMPFFFS